jgi:hypothetical protein
MRGFDLRILGKELDLHSESEEDNNIPDDARDGVSEEEEEAGIDDDELMISKTFMRLVEMEKPKALKNYDDSATGMLMFICSALSFFGTFILESDTEDDDVPVASPHPRRKSPTDNAQSPPNKRKKLSAPSMFHESPLVYFA